MVDSIDTHGRLLSLPIRFYQFARLYGPGMPASGEEGLHERTFVKPVSQVGLVSVHCWNLGESTGPYPIGADAHCPGEMADWVPTAHEIIANTIRPVLDAARDAGVAVFHLAQENYAPRYPQYLAILDDPALQPQSAAGPVEGSVRPRPIEEKVRDIGGPTYPGAVWKTHPDSFDIAEAVRPLPSEAVFLDGWQLNGLCRRLDIDTLFYVGFMADLCVANVPGAIREMTQRFGYRCIVLRDCTVAHEFVDTYETRCMTRAAIRLIETDLGYSASSPDFIAAARRPAQANPRSRAIR